MLPALMLLGVLNMDVEVGQNLTPPAQVAGPWEGLVAPGEVAGFTLQIITNADEKVRSLNLDTYIRKDGKTMRTWWSNGDPGSSFVLREGHLQFHQARTTNTGFDVTLDLTYSQTDMSWKGSFSDPFFTGQVTLRRPTFSDSSAPVGTWRTDSDLVIWPTQSVETYGCLNLGVGQDGALILWNESHNIFLGGDVKQPVFGDSYGEFYDDSEVTRSAVGWSFILSTGAGGYRVTGALSSDDASFGGFYSDQFGNGMRDPLHPQRPFAWTRMLNLACRP